MLVFTYKYNKTVYLIHVIKKHYRKAKKRKSFPVHVFIDDFIYNDKEYKSVTPLYLV